MFSDEMLNAPWTEWEGRDKVQVEEDDWVSTILGSEDETINDICNA